MIVDRFLFIQFCYLNNYDVLLGKWTYVGQGESQGEEHCDDKIFDDNGDGGTRPKMLRRSRRIALMKMERERREQNSADNGDSSSAPSDVNSSVS